MKTSVRFFITSIVAICSVVWCVSNALAQQPPQAPVYSNVRYEDDYSFLNDENRGNDPFNQLKKIPLGGAARLTLGGHYRFRYERDAHRRFGASNPSTQTFFLNRVFLFSDLQFGKRGRLFGEIKYAGITDNELPAALTAHDKPDVQNLFADVWLRNNEKDKFGARVGRQEMQLGRQRLVSPLDWVNTRRTFDGVRLMANAAGWKFDAFATKVAEHDPEEIDRANESQLFTGFYAQRSHQGKTFSAYYLALKEDDLLVKSGQGVSGTYNCHTIGAGYDGTVKNFDWTTEAAYQFGRFSVDDIGAYMLGLEAGYTLNKTWAKPRLAFGFDLASGDKDPFDDKKQTFNQIFPLAHPYFGWADQVARQNIQALTLSATIKPHKRLSAKVQGLNFKLAQERDALYNAGGAAGRRDLNGAAGNEVGKEFDAEVTLNLGVHVSTMVGYTHFMPGNFIKTTGPSQAHNFFYVMVPVKF